MQASVKEDRDKYIGGSDIPVILGISPFKTRWELIQEKAGLVKNDFEGNEYTDYGNVMESKIRDFINESEKDKFVEGKHIDGNIRCHTDGENKTTILEIKTTSRIHYRLEDYKIYLVQLLFYMKHTNRKKGKLAVYYRTDNWDESMHVKEHLFDYNFKEKFLQLFDINLSDYKELVEEINQAVEMFVRDVERVKENPFLTEQDLLPQEIVEKAKRLEDFEIILKDQEKVKKEYDELKKSLFDSMEKYCIKKWITPNETKITLVEPTENKVTQEIKFDEEAFKKEYPDLFEKFSKRVEKVTKGKAGFLRITVPKGE